MTSISNITRVPSSPRYPESSGMAERSVKMVKDLLRKESSLEDVLLAYRATPLASGFSPVQLMFGRWIRSKLGLHVDQKTDYLKYLLNPRRPFQRKRFFSNPADEAKPWRKRPTLSLDKSAHWFYPRTYVLQWPLIGWAFWEGNIWSGPCGWDVTENGCISTFRRRKSNILLSHAPVFWKR